MTDVKTLQQENQYFAQIEISGLSSRSIRTYRSLASLQRIKSLHLSIAKANVVDPGYHGVNSIGLYANDWGTLHRFITDYGVVDQYFYKTNDVSDIDYVIPKGNLKIKAGSYLQIFERVGNIKLSKGFIQLLEPVTVLKRGGVIEERFAQVLQILQKRLKLRKSQVINVGSLIDGKKVSKSVQHVHMVYNGDELERMVQQFVSFLKSHDRSQPITIQPYVGLKLAKFLKVLNTSIGENDRL